MCHNSCVSLYYNSTCSFGLSVVRDLRTGESEGAHHESSFTENSLVEEGPLTTPFLNSMDWRVMALPMRIMVVSFLRYKIRNKQG
jgi:hypothetical protein